MRRPDIPPQIRRQLRKEVGYACPEDGCNSPYLEYHHFDPPWHQGHVHEPTGMIPLCPTHHSLADNRPPSYYHQLKDAVKFRPVEATLPWMARELVIRAGGTVFDEVPIPVQVNGHNCVELERNDLGLIELTLRWPSLRSLEPRLFMDRNDWRLQTEPRDLRASAQGRELEVETGQGERMSLKFSKPIHSIGDAPKSFQKYLATRADFPHEGLICLEIQVSAPWAHLEMTASEIRKDTITIIGGQILGGNVGISL